MALPVDEQKPNDIKKNKPKTRDKDRQRQSGDEDNEEGEFDDNYYDDQGAWGNGSQYNNAGRNSRRSSGGRWPPGSQEQPRQNVARWWGTS